MKELKIRDVDARTYTYLRDKAKEKGVSMNRYINILLDSIATRDEVKAIDEMYKALFSDMLPILQNNANLYKEVAILLEDIKERIY